MPSGAENRPIEREDSSGGADRVQDVVRGARHDAEPGLDRAHPHVQRPPAEDGRGGDGEAVQKPRAGGSCEGSGAQGAGPSDGGGFRAELERRAADGGDGKLTEFRPDEALIDVDIVGSRLFRQLGLLGFHPREEALVECRRTYSRFRVWHIVAQYLGGLGLGTRLSPPLVCRRLPVTGSA